MTPEQHPALSRRRLALRGWIPYALFAVACALSIVASWYVSAAAGAQLEAERIADKARFETDAEKTRQQIEFRLNTYVEVARAGAALIGASNEISQPDFRAFVRGLQLRERYPGMVGIGFAPRVTQRNRREFLREVRLDSARRFSIRPAGVRSAYHPVLFLEPIDEASGTSIGFDLSTDAALGEVMERARDTGQPAASPLLETEPFGRSGQGANVLVIPVYRPRARLDTVDDRRGGLVGFVFSPLHVEQVLASIVANTTRSISFEVYDISNATRPNLLAETTAPRNPGMIESTGSVQVAGRAWSVVVRSADIPVTVARPTAIRTLVSGLLLSVLLFFIVRSQVRAWETTARQEAELRTTAQALRESEAQAQAADRAKDEFLATLSHELRTPLNAILGWVTLLRRGSIGDERRSHGLGVIERNARLQAHLIEDLLDVSRIVMGKVRLHMRPLPVATVIFSAVESLRPGAEAKGVHLHTTLTDDGVIHGDSDRLQQIIWNLIANAIKFTPAKGQVHVEVWCDQRYAHISVRDTGIGIDPAFLPHVFERFRQGDSSTTRPHSGIGIGLSIVQHLVELHGGSIEVRSEGRDYGTEFLVHLPLTASTAPAASVFAAGMRIPAQSLVEGMRVLVVDDDPDTRDLLTDALGTLGAQVTAVDSAQHALERLIASGADVVVSDLAMPDEDGFSLIRRIRELPEPLARVPAIALTAFARADDRAKAIEAGFQMHIAKPVELADLQAGLATLTASKHPPAQPV